MGKLRNYLEVGRDCLCNDMVACMWALEFENPISLPGTAWLLCSFGKSLHPSEPVFQQMNNNLLCPISYDLFPHCVSYDKPYHEIEALFFACFKWISHPTMAPSSPGPLGLIWHLIESQLNVVRVCSIFYKSTMVVHKEAAHKYNLISNWPFGWQLNLLSW